MKKLLVLGTLLAFCAPVFAAEKCEDGDCRNKMKGPRQEMIRKSRDGKREMKPGMKAKMEAAKAQRKARKAKFKENEAQLEKLVKEYKAAKEGSKKQAAAKEGIVKVLNGVRDEQITLRSEQLQGFEKRLEMMKKRLAEEEMPEAKSAWVEKMTEQIIAEDGDLMEALENQGRMGRDPHEPLPLLPPVVRPVVE